MSKQLLDRMTWASRERLSDHVKAHGAMVLETRMPTRVIQSRLGLSAKDARRLGAWLRANGTRDPIPSPQEALPGPSAAGRTHLVVGDAHAAPGQNLRRFTWLGRMINEIRPDVLVSIGDWSGMDSLCDHSTLEEREGGRLTHDLEAGSEALDMVAREVDPDLWARLQKEITLGNHDIRPERHEGRNPAYVGAFPTVRTTFESHGFRVHDYQKYAKIDGVAYSHNLNVKGRITSGMYHAEALLRKTQFDQSITVGHSHGYQQRFHRTRSGRIVRGLVCGCFFEHYEEYAKQDNEHWWRGVFVKRDVAQGDYRLEEWPMGVIQRRWGG